MNSRPKSAIVKSRLQTRKLKNPAYLTISVYFCYNVLDSQEDKHTAMSINTSMLEIAINAAAGRHDLTGFSPVTGPDQKPNGYQARVANATAPPG